MTTTPSIDLEDLDSSAEVLRVAREARAAAMHADAVVLTGNKETDKVYRRHTGYLGGLKTTAAVVQAIFLVVVLDALFAVIFYMIGWP